MSEINDDGIIKFNTEDTLKGSSYAVEERIPIFNLVPENDPILREYLPNFDFANPPVNPAEFASSLIETCKKYKGMGLSANQCGYRHRVFVMGARDEFVAFFNPKIVMKSNDDVHLEEGCLSFPMLGLMITRPAEIMVEYQDFNGQVRNTQLSGISARCFQHELDHMNGILYTDRVKPMALQSGLKKRAKIKKMVEKMNKNLAKITNGNTN
jgi:peptide deformylase